MRTCIAAASPRSRYSTTFADWVDRACADVPEDRFQKMLDREHGGMNEVFADLSAADAERRAICSWRCAFPTGASRSAGCKVSTSSTACTRTPRSPRSSASAASTTWAVPTPSPTTVPRSSSGVPWSNGRSFATGGHGDGEHFFPKDKFVEHLGSAKTMETCCTHNMMRLTRSLYARDPQVGLSRLFRTRVVQRHPRRRRIRRRA